MSAPAFDLRLITSFVAVGELKHFGKAASAVHATQPGVSQHIAKLEAQLGTQLLARSRRSVELTPAGATFLVHARALLTHIDRMRNETRRVANGELGELALGLSSSVVYSGIPAEIARFKRQIPDLTVRLEVSNGTKLHQLLESGSIDMAITTLPPSKTSLRGLVVSSQAMGVAVPASHKLAGQKRVQMKSLLKERYIVVPRASHPENHDALVARIRELGGNLQIAAEEVSFQNCLARVALEEGIALVPLALATRALNSVRMIPLQDATLGRLNILSVTRSDKLLPVADRLQAALRTAASVHAKAD